MSDPDLGRKRMSAVEFDTLHQRSARTLVRMRAERMGMPQPLARVAIARELGIAPSKVERAEKGRFKSVSAWLYERVQALFIRELEREIERLTHELAMARKAGLGASDRDFSEAATALATAQSLVREATR